MSTAVATACVGLAIAAVVARRRSVVLVLVTLQSALLAGVAVWHAAGDVDLAPAAAGLVARTIVIAAMLGLGIARTREARPVRAGIEPMTRAALALAALLVVPALVPPLGIVAEDVQGAAIALCVLGIMLVLTRRATIVQILGIVVAENGATLLALAAPSGVPGVIEMGVVFDLVLIVVVAIAFHDRIFGEFGSGDTEHLRGLHD